MLKSRKYPIILISTLLAVIILLFSLDSFAGWKYNPFTKKLDYYEGESDLGLDIPQPYISSPSVTDIKNLLILAGIMSAAPTIDITWQDRTGLIFQDRSNLAWQDHTWTND